MSRFSWSGLGSGGSADPPPGTPKGLVGPPPEAGFWPFFWLFFQHKRKGAEFIFLTPKLTPQKQVPRTPPPGIKKKPLQEVQQQLGLPQPQWQPSYVVTYRYVVICSGIVTHTTFFRLGINTGSLEGSPHSPQLQNAPKICPKCPFSAVLEFF